MSPSPDLPPVCLPCREMELCVSFQQAALVLRRLHRREGCWSERLHHRVRLKVAGDSKGQGALEPSLTFFMQWLVSYQCVSLSSLEVFVQALTGLKG